MANSLNPLNMHACDPDEFNKFKEFKEIESERGFILCILNVTILPGN